MTTICYSDTDQLFLLPGPTHKMTPIFFNEQKLTRLGVATCFTTNYKRLVYCA